MSQSSASSTGSAAQTPGAQTSAAPVRFAPPRAHAGWLGFSRAQSIAFLVMIAVIVAAPFVLYPVFLMRVLCMALFACAFNLMIGYVGLLSFGHAAFFGMGSYIAAWTMKFWHVDAVVAIVLAGATGAVLG